MTCCRELSLLPYYIWKVYHNGSAYHITCSLYHVMALLSCKWCAIFWNRYNLSSHIDSIDTIDTTDFPWKITKNWTLKTNYVLDIKSKKHYVPIWIRSKHRWKMNNSNGGVCTGSFDCATNSWCEVVIKGTSDEANGTMQPRLVNDSLMGHAYTNFGSEC